MYLSYSPCLFRFFVYFRFSSGLDGKGKKDVPLRTAYSQNGRCGMQPKAKHSLRTQAQLSETKTETMRTESVETFELWHDSPGWALAFSKSLFQTSLLLASVHQFPVLKTRRSFTRPSIHLRFGLPFLRGPIG
ncbi:hypothetical protein TNCV_4819231 [Trichonephila clavipes]|nr:hypothetical protein TNCV_4819231 [Trichonephila clavipes]